MRRGESGSAILLAIFVLVLLVGLGAALLFMVQSELSMSRSTNNEKAAFHLAEAGLEAGRMILLDTNGGGDFTDDLQSAANGDASLDINPKIISPIFDSSGTLTGFNGVGNDVPLQAIATLNSADASGGFFAAYLSNDPTEGVTTTSDVNRRVMLTGIGVDRSRAWEVVQAIVEPWHHLPSVPMAAMTMIGPAPTYDNGNSNAQAHTGTDCPLGGGIPNTYVPIVGLTNDGSEAQVESDMNRPDKFTSGALTEHDTVGNLNDPTDPAMAQSSLPTLDPSWMDCAYIASMVQGLIAGADFYCNTDSGSCTTPVGNAGDIVVIDGDATAGAFDAGLLLVTGELTYSGNSAWSGIVLVIGEGRLHRNGAGNGHNTGAVILANVDPSPGGLRADKSDWCNSGFGQTSFTVNGAGSSTISYCSDDVTQNNPVRTYPITDFLQR